MKYLASLLTMLFLCSLSGITSVSAQELEEAPLESSEFQKRAVEEAPTFTEDSGTGTVDKAVSTELTEAQAKDKSQIIKIQQVDQMEKELAEAVADALIGAREEAEARILEIQRAAKQEKELAVADAVLKAREEVLSETESRIKKAIAETILKAQEDAQPSKEDREYAQADLVFLKEAFKTASKDVFPFLLSQVENHLSRFRELPGADNAQFLKARIHEKQSSFGTAAVDILKLLYEYPDTKLVFNAKKMLFQIADKKLRKQKTALTSIAKGPAEGLDRPGRIVALLKHIATLKHDAFYKPLVIEIREFLQRYPNHPEAGTMHLFLSQIHARNSRYEIAILINKKILFVFKAPDLLAKTLLASGDIYADSLKDYDKAIEAYQTVTNNFPMSEEAGYAYVKMARMLDKNLKQPALAVEILEKMINLYPNSEAAYQAFQGIARIQESKLGDPSKAIEALNATADMFPGERAVTALSKAVGIADSSKDFSSKVAILEKLATDYPQDKAAPDALWAAGQTYEKKLEDPSSAKDSYDKLVEAYPIHKLAKKAQKRIKALSK